MKHAENLRTPLISLVITAALAFAGVMTLRADSRTPSTGVPVTVLVTATSHKSSAPAVPENEVVVRQNGDVRQVISWKPAAHSGAGLDLAILIDDQASQRLASNLDELRQFVRAQNSDTRVAVAYANYGAVQMERDFTSEHELAAKALRIPSAIRGTSNGTYDSVRELVKHWPNDGNRHVLLLISSGIDLTNGVGDTNPYRNLPLSDAIESAQRANVVVYTIFAAGDTRALRNDYLTTNGQGSLERLANETGGHAFFQGLSTPVSLQPFLQEFSGMLGQQYLLTFMADANSKDEFSRLKVTSEQSGVELHAPEHVLVPRAQ